MTEQERQEQERRDRERQARETALAAGQSPQPSASAEQTPAPQAASDTPDQNNEEHNTVVTIGTQQFDLRQLGDDQTRYDALEAALPAEYKGTDGMIARIEGILLNAYKIAPADAPGFRLETIASDYGRFMNGASQAASGYVNQQIDVLMRAAIGQGHTADGQVREDNFFGGMAYAGEGFQHLFGAVTGTVGETIDSTTAFLAGGSEEERRRRAHQFAVAYAAAHYEQNREVQNLPFFSFNGPSLLLRNPDHAIGAFFDNSINWPIVGSFIGMVWPYISAAWEVAGEVLAHIAEYATNQRSWGDLGQLFETKRQEAIAKAERNRGASLEELTMRHVSEGHRGDVGQMLRDSGPFAGLSVERFTQVTNLFENGGVVRMLNGEMHGIESEAGLPVDRPLPGPNGRTLMAGDRVNQEWVGVAAPFNNGIQFTAGEAGYTTAAAAIIGTGIIIGRKTDLVGKVVRGWNSVAHSPIRGWAHARSGFMRGYAHGRAGHNIWNSKDAGVDFHSKVRSKLLNVQRLEARLARQEVLRASAEEKLRVGGMHKRETARQQHILDRANKEIPSLEKKLAADIPGKANMRGSAVRELESAIARAQNAQSLNKHAQLRQIGVTQVEGRWVLTRDGVPTVKHTPNLRFVANAGDVSETISRRLTAQSARASDIITRLTDLQTRGVGAAASGQMDRALTEARAAQRAIEDARTAQQATKAASDALRAAEAAKNAAVAAGNATEIARTTQLAADAAQNLSRVTATADNALEAALRAQDAARSAVEGLHRAMPTSTVSSTILDASGRPIAPTVTSNPVDDILSESRNLHGTMERNAVFRDFGSPDPAVRLRAVQALDVPAVTANRDVLTLISSDHAHAVQPDVARLIDADTMPNMQPATLANLSHDALEAIPPASWANATRAQIEALGNKMLSPEAYGEIFRANPTLLDSIPNDILRGKTAEQIRALLGGLDEDTLHAFMTSQRLSFVDERIAQEVVEGLRAADPKFFKNWTAEDIRRQPQYLAQHMEAGDVNERLERTLEQRSGRQAKVMDGRASDADEALREVERIQAANGAHLNDVTRAEEAIERIREAKGVWGFVEDGVGIFGRVCGHISKIPYLGEGLFALGFVGAGVTVMTTGEANAAVRELESQDIVTAEQRSWIEEYHRVLASGDGFDALPFVGAACAGTVTSEVAYYDLVSRLREQNVPQPVIDLIEVPAGTSLRNMGEDIANCVTGNNRSGAVGASTEAPTANETSLLVADNTEFHAAIAAECAAIQQRLDNIRACQITVPSTFVMANTSCSLGSVVCEGDVSGSDPFRPTDLTNASQPLREARVAQ